MVGLFGYFSLDEPQKEFHNTVETLTNAVRNCTEEEKLNIEECIKKGSLFIGKIASSNNKSHHVEKNIGGLDIVSVGEVFDESYLDLDKLILSLYRKDTLNELQQINGSFAAVIGDDGAQKMLLLNDRYGLIKHFYYCDGKRFVFSPRIRPLLSCATGITLRKDAIIDFLLFGYLLGDKTFFNNIYQFTPGAMIEVSKSGLKYTKYWDYSYIESYTNQPWEELLEELQTLWQRAVERRTKNADKIIIPLSGGLDSRAILAAAMRVTSADNIVTFTFGEDKSYDFRIGRMVAKKAGIESLLLESERDDFEKQYDIHFSMNEGMIDASPYFPIKRYKNLTRYGKEILSGYMGGELMGSHVSQKMLRKGLTSQEDYDEAARIILSEHKLNDVKEVSSLLSQSHFDINNILSSFNESLNECKDAGNTDMANFCAAWDYKNRQDKYIMYAIFRFRNKFEYIAPFLDNELVDFMLKVPPELRLNEYLYKKMLTESYPELFNTPTRNALGLRLNDPKAFLYIKRLYLFSKRRTNRLASKIMRRNIFQDVMKNYIDYDDFLRKDIELQNYFERKLDDVKARAYFNQDYINILWLQHLNGKANHFPLLGLLVTFELLLEKFLD